MNIVERIITSVIVRVASREIATALYRKRAARRYRPANYRPTFGPTLSGRGFLLIVLAVTVLFVIFNH